MQKNFRLKSSASFRYIYKKGKSFSGKNMTITLVPAYNLKVGFSVSKKVGNAVIRNLIKRRLREAFRLQIKNNGGYNLVITAKENAANATYRDLYDEMGFLLKKSGFANNEKNL